MALIVAYNGQFKPYKLPKTPAILPRAERISRVTPIFRDLLQDYLEKELPETMAKDSGEGKKISAVKAYEKIQNHVRARVYARDIMYSFVKTLPSNATVGDAMTMMQKNQFHHIPVVDEEKLYGIVSDRSILNALSQGDNLTTTLYQVMSKKVISAQEHTSISDIARVMLDENIHCLPIVDSKVKLKGIVTTSDILSFLVTSFPVEIYG